LYRTIGQLHVVNNIKFKVIGEIENLPKQTINLINEIESLTSNATGLNLTFAFSYGGRAEILRAVNNFTTQNPGKALTEQDINSLMYRPETGDVDLMIRTGGEHRVSNFLLWQMAYSELYFTPTKWPDFTYNEFEKILEKVANRERRFGNVSSQSGLIDSSGRAEANRTNFMKGTITDV